MRKLAWGRAMTNRVRSEPCVNCVEPDCGAMVILRGVASEKKHFDQATDSIQLVCPACGRAFSAPIFKVEWFDAYPEEFRRGFFGSLREHHWFVSWARRAFWGMHHDEAAHSGL